MIMQRVILPDLDPIRVDTRRAVVIGASATAATVSSDVDGLADLSKTESRSAAGVAMGRGVRADAGPTGGKRLLASGPAIAAGGL